MPTYCKSNISIKPPIIPLNCIPSNLYIYNNMDIDGYFCLNIDELYKNIIQYQSLQDYYQIEFTYKSYESNTWCYKLGTYQFIYEIQDLFYQQDATICQTEMNIISQRYNET